MTRSVPPCWPQWLWSHIPFIWLGVCTVYRQRLWYVSQACHSTARGSVPWWWASTLFWWRTTSGVALPLSCWYDFCNPHSPLRALLCTACWRRGNGFDCYVIYHLLKGVLFSVELVVLLELEEIVPFGVVLNFWVEEISILMRLQLRYWFPAARRILVLMSTIGRKTCLRPHLVVSNGNISNNKEEGRGKTSFRIDRGRGKYCNRVRIFCADTYATSSTCGFSLWSHSTRAPRLKYLLNYLLHNRQWKKLYWSR